MSMRVCVCIHIYIHIYTYVSVYIPGAARGRSTCHAPPPRAGVRAFPGEFQKFCQNSVPQCICQTKSLRGCFAKSRSETVLQFRSLLMPFYPFPSNNNAFSSLLIPVCRQELVLAILSYQYQQYCRTPSNNNAFRSLLIPVYPYNKQHLELRQQFLGQVSLY